MEHPPVLIRLKLSVADSNSIVKPPLGHAVDAVTTGSTINEFYRALRSIDTTLSPLSAGQGVSVGGVGYIGHKYVTEASTTVRRWAMSRFDGSAFIASS